MHKAALGSPGASAGAERELSLTATAELQAAEDRAACAWELTGALGLTVRVKGDDLVIDPDDVDQWWPPIRDRVVRAYRERRCD